MEREENLVFEREREREREGGREEGTMRPVLGHGISIGNDQYKYMYTIQVSSVC